MNRVARRRRRRGDEGQASVLLIMLMPVVMIVFALVWETGQMLVTKAELLTVAHAAARVGAHQLDTVATVENGTPVLDPEGARRAATGHLRSAGSTGGAQIEGDRVVVLARTVYTPALLPIGPSEIEVEATATALQSPPR